MPERLVDVSGSNKTVLHTFPITVSSSAGDVMPKDAEYEGKALRAAAHAQLYPMRISEADHQDACQSEWATGTVWGRSGRSVPNEARSGSGRSRARLLALGDGWLSAWGCRWYWNRAHDQHLRERAYILWQQEGCPTGQAAEHWHRTQQFEITLTDGRSIGEAMAACFYSVIHRPYPQFDYAGELSWSLCKRSPSGSTMHECHLAVARRPTGGSSQFITRI